MTTYESSERKRQAQGARVAQPIYVPNEIPAAPLPSGGGGANVSQLMMAMQMLQEMQKRKGGGSMMGAKSGGASPLGPPGTTTPSPTGYM